MKKEEEKRCFIITPIGSETDPIRRHIEGIIEAAIQPALENKYKLSVAHKICEPGSITKQVISEIYNADLVVANLTNRNPNVMYELAFRHCLGKPAIMIAELGTSLPVDIIMERVIFYQNDAQGVLELKRAIEKAESEIDFAKIESPIYDVLHSINRDKSILQLSQQDTQAGQEVLPYILEKLNRLEDIVLLSKSSNSTHFSSDRKWTFEYPNINIPERNVGEILNAFCDAVGDIPDIVLYSVESNNDGKSLIARFFASEDVTARELQIIFNDVFAKIGLENIGLPLMQLD